MSQHCAPQAARVRQRRPAFAIAVCGEPGRGTLRLEFQVAGFVFHHLQPGSKSPVRVHRAGTKRTEQELHREEAAMATVSLSVIEKRSDRVVSVVRPVPVGLFTVGGRAHLRRVAFRSH